jgi:hypothetical protein
MSATQNFKNHTRFDPAFHFFLAPILLVNFVLSIYDTIHEWPMDSRPHLWWIVMSVAIFLIAGKARNYALQAQDRTIRLEERLRFAKLLPEASLAASHALSIKQYVALRFAPDDEVPELVRRTLAENLTPKQIKESIQNWRPDYDRI